jgi:phosphate transport system protein
MMRVKFQQRLDELKEMLLHMAGLSEQAIHRAIECYCTRNVALCDLVVNSECAINELEREIDRRAAALLATEQPMATDLRFILAVLRINKDVERVGDQAVSIARNAKDIAMYEADMPVDIPRIAELASTMVRRAMEAFVTADAREADSVLKLDAQVDKLNHAAFRSLSTLIQEKPETAQQALGTLLIARNIERIGDHATNIAEDVIFWVQGSDVRHTASTHAAVA